MISLLGMRQSFSKPIHSLFRMTISESCGAPLDARQASTRPSTFLISFRGQAIKSARSSASNRGSGLGLPVACQPCMRTQDARETLSQLAIELDVMAERLERRLQWEAKA